MIILPVGGSNHSMLKCEKVMKFVILFHADVIMNKVVAVWEWTMSANTACNHCRVPKCNNSNIYTFFIHVSMVLVMKWLCAVHLDEGKKAGTSEINFTTVSTSNSSWRSSDLVYLCVSVPSTFWQVSPSALETPMPGIKANTLTTKLPHPLYRHNTTLFSFASKEDAIKLACDYITEVPNL